MGTSIKIYSIQSQYCSYMVQSVCVPLRVIIMTLKSFVNNKCSLFKNNKNISINKLT